MHSGIYTGGKYLDVRMWRIFGTLGAMEHLPGFIILGMYSSMCPAVDVLGYLPGVYGTLDVLE